MERGEGRGERGEGRYILGEGAEGKRGINIIGRRRREGGRCTF
jgi:hypothetical protein